MKKVWVVQSNVNDGVEAVCATEKIADAVAKETGCSQVLERDFLESIPVFIKEEILAQIMLSDQMSRMSEERWCASWLDGLEFMLWRALNGGKEVADWSISELIELAKLHGHARGWFVFDENGKRFVTTEEWLPIFEAHEKVKNV